MSRTAAESLAASAAQTAASLQEQQQVSNEIARALYPGLPGSSAQKTWSDFWYVFNETQRQAGMGALTGGPVGAVIGGLAAAITGIIQASNEGKVRRQTAVRWARTLGIEDASSFPSFLVDLQGMGLRERVDLVHALDRQIERTASTKKRRKLTQRREAVMVLLQLNAFRLQQTQALAQSVVARAAQARQAAGLAQSAEEVAARQARQSRTGIVAAGIAAVIAAGAGYVIASLR